MRRNEATRREYVLIVGRYIYRETFAVLNHVPYVIPPEGFVCKMAETESGKSFSVLELAETSSVIIAQRSFHTRFGEKPPSSPTV